jgi:ABC-type glycerol-3-phosphate transport system substrate-binding protein
MATVNPTARKVLAGAAAAAMLVALAGCGNGNTPDVDPDAAPEAGPLTVWLGGILAQATPGSAYREWFDAQVDEFEAAYPGTEIKVVLMDPDGVKQTAQYRAAFGAKKGPDFAMMYPAGFTTEFESSLLDLNEVAPEVLEQFPEATLQFGCENFDCTNGAPVLLAPYDVSGWVLAYNKAIFAEVGIEAPFASWDDMVAAGEKLKAAGYVPFQMGNRDGYIADAYLSNMYSSYLEPADIGAVLRGELPVTDDKFVKPLELWAGLYEDGLVNEDACSLEALASQQDFIAGKAATVATYDYSNLYTEMTDNLGVMTWPTITDGSNAANGGQASAVGQGWAIPKDSANIPLAKAFLAQLTSAESQTAQFEIAGSPPANPEASTANAPDPATAEATVLFQNSTVTSFDAALPVRSQTAYFKETNLALCGKTSAQDAMSAVQDELEREIR